MKARLGISVLCALAAAGCGASAHHTATTVAQHTPSTVWLCRPGLAGNPCLAGLSTTVVERGGATHVVPASPAKNPPVDCFYVYPTVSNQPTVNANLRIGLQETAVAVTQASRFSQVCRIFAPVYRQITLGALDHPRRITLAVRASPTRASSRRFATTWLTTTTGAGSCSSGIRRARPS